MAFQVRGPGTHEKLHLGNLLVDFLHELDDEVNQFVLQHLLGVGVGDQKRDVISLQPQSAPFPHVNHDVPTLIGFRRNMKKLSALCVKNLVNLWTKICSISSACFIRIETRTELTDGSMRTFSFSLRAMVRGFSRTSGDDAASISGTLCRSEVCEAKLVRESAAVRDERTHWR
jgi:hypothetical protein